MTQPPPFRALTVTAQGGLLRVISTDCGVAPEFDPATLPTSKHPQFQKFTAIWDTGATSSAITQDVVDACGLKPHGITQVHGVGGVHHAEKFLVSFSLPNEVTITGIEVTRAKELFGAQVLIGMDVIVLGDFSITNVGGQTIFSFRFPSVKAVDFVKEAKGIAAAAMKRQARARKGRRNKKHEKRRPWN